MIEAMVLIAALVGSSLAYGIARGTFGRGRTKHRFHDLPSALCFLSGTLSFYVVFNAPSHVVWIGILCGSLLWLAGCALLTVVDGARRLMTLAFLVALGAHAVLGFEALRRGREASAELSKMERDPFVQWCRHPPVGGGMTETGMGCIGVALAAVGEEQRVAQVPWLLGGSAVAVASMLLARRRTRE